MKNLNLSMDEAAFLATFFIREYRESGPVRKKKIAKLHKKLGLGDIRKAGV